MASILVDLRQIKERSQRIEKNALAVATPLAIAIAHLGIVAIAIYLGATIAIVLHTVCALCALAFAVVANRGVSLQGYLWAGCATILLGFAIIIFVYPGPTAIVVYIFAPIPAFRILGLTQGSVLTLAFAVLFGLALTSDTAAAQISGTLRLNIAFSFVIATLFGLALEFHRKQSDQQLAYHLHEIRALGGLVPICSVCRKLRDEDVWKGVEEVLSTKGHLEFTHGYCEQCAAAAIEEAREAHRQRSDAKRIEE